MIASTHNGDYRGWFGLPRTVVSPTARHLRRSDSKRLGSLFELLETLLSSGGAGARGASKPFRNETGRRRLTLHEDDNHADSFCSIGLHDRRL